MTSGTLLLLLACADDPIEVVGQQNTVTLRLVNPTAVDPFDGAQTLRV